MYGKGNIPYHMWKFLRHVEFAEFKILILERSLTIQLCIRTYIAQIFPTVNHSAIEDYVTSRLDLIFMCC